MQMPGDIPAGHFGYNTLNLNPSTARGAFFIDWKDDPAIIFSRFAAQFLGLIFSKADFLVPFRKHASNEFWLAIRHPKPVYPVHFLILPRRGWKDVFQIPLEDPQIAAALLQITAALIRNEKLDENQCRLVINGGGFQIAPLVHAHLISG